MSRILYSFSVIAFGLLLGYGVRLASERGLVRLRWSMPVLRTFLQRLALLGLSPFTFIGALWVVEIREPRLALLAGLGAFCHIFGGLAGALLVVTANPVSFCLAAVLGFGVNSMAYIVIQTSSSLTLKVGDEGGRGGRR